MDDLARASGTAPATTSPSELTKRAMGDLARSAFVYDKNPIAKPRVRSDFFNLPLIVRIAEVLRYSIACLEYRLGPDGWVRGWLFFLTRILVISLGLSGTMCLIIWSVVPIFGGADSIAHHMASIAESVFWTIFYLFLACLVFFASLSFIHRKDKTGSGVKYVASKEH